MNSINEITYLLGQKWRNPSLRDIYRYLKESEKLDREELEINQYNRLKELLIFASKYSSYYKELFKQLEFDPESIQSLEDIVKIPILDKEILLKNADKIQTNKNYHFSKLFKASTSGTTGDSLTFFKNEYADSFNRASIQRGYSWYGVNPWDFNGYFWGFNFSFFKKIKIRFLDFLLNRYRLFSYNTKELDVFIKKIQKAIYLEGYSSMIYETAKLINRNKLSKPQKIKMVKGTSEKIFDSYQDEVKEVFGIKMISEYGAAETGIIAFECPYGNMHINMEGVYVEEINKEIIVTNLIMKSFPIIRYKLGDTIQLDKINKTCSCGLKHPIIKEVTGRIGQNIYGIQAIYPSLTFYYIFKNLDKRYSLLLTYQVIQNKKGVLDFRIAESLNKKDRKRLEEEIVKYFERDIHFYIYDNYQFSVNRNKKFKSFISNIK